MKLRAIRLQEVGHFRTGVALEGLSGRFDVIAGPNEMGKSTIFRALDVAFRWPHDSERTVAKDLEPNTGGAPLIEVEFEAAGTLWRLRKRYLAQKSAELLDLGGAMRLLRGSDAEAKLASLLAGRLDRKPLLSLLWVGQQQSLNLPDLANNDVAGGVGRLIEDAIADAAGQGTARRVRAAVALALKGLVSKVNRKPAANTAYKAAVDARDRAHAELERATAAAQAAATRLVQLKGLHARAAVLNAPEAVAARERALADLRMRHEDARRTDEAVKRADLDVAAKAAARDRIAADLGAMRVAIEEARRLQSRFVELSAELTTAAAARTETAAALADLQAQMAHVRARAAELQALLGAHDRAARQRAAADAAADLARRLDGIRSTQQRNAAIDRELREEAVTPEILVSLRSLQGEIDRQEARLAAGLPRVRIDYAAGAVGRISSAGMPIGASGELAPAQTLVLDIAGVGRITVAAPAAAAAEDQVSALAAARQAMHATLDAIKAEGIAAAETRLQARQKLSAERHALLHRMRDDAPDGIAALEQRLDLAMADAAASGPEEPVPTQSREVLVLDLATVSAALNSQETAEHTMQAAVLEASTRHARLDSEFEATRARLREVEAVLPAPVERSSTLEGLAKQQDETEAALNAALRERSAWVGGQVTPAARAELAASITTAERAGLDFERQRQQIALDQKGVQSALERDRQDGVEAAATEAAAAFEEAEARVSAFRREVDELLLLERLLDAEAAGSRQRQLAPVVTRLQAYAREVVPGATFELGEALRVTGLVRGGQAIMADRLSGGTEEQIQILVRLAYARLLADRGDPLPVLLDDALVYADESRHLTMLSTLAMAATQHQVIMLTCHPERLRHLGPDCVPTRIEVTSWTPNT